VVALAVLLGGFLLALVRTAWVCDDAYLTLRSVENLLAGFGPRWNVAERVQVYTHPAWMALLAAGRLATGEVYFSTLALSAAVSLATVVLVALGFPSPGRLTALALLLGSKAVVDFSTSGLENPLTHLLLALFVLGCFGPASTPRLVLLGALLALSRLDAVLLVAPALAWTLWTRRSAWPRVAAAALPLVLWEAFSVVYYGTPWPNTAYAKLGTGIPAGELLAQGLHYLADSLHLDPLTLPAVLLGTLAGLVSSHPAARALALGIVLELAYVVRAGGDFMSGRFLTGCLLVAALLLARISWRHHTLVALAIVAVSLLPPRAPLRSGVVYVYRGRDHGIADERGVYFQAMGFWAERGIFAPPRHPRIEAGRALRASGRPIATTTAAGLTAYYAGPGVHFVDRLALGDPLLARLPVPREWSWRVGHYERAIPDGYLETLRSGVNQIRDPRVAALYERVRLVTRGPLFDPDRWRAIVAPSFGPPAAGDPVPGAR
jgi:arabinofuranosyltransferase